MSDEEFSELAGMYVAGRLSRRRFVRRLVAGGASVVAANALAGALNASPAMAVVDEGTYGDDDTGEDETGDDDTDTGADDTDNGDDDDGGTYGEEPHGPTAGVAMTKVQRGQTQRGRATGFAPGEVVTGEQRSTPLALGTQIADAAGAVLFTWRIRDDETLGYHRFWVSGQSGSASVSFEVVDATVTLPETR